MKITLKTVVLIALLTFYVIIILSNFFSQFEGFVASDDSALSRNVLTGASDTALPVPKSTGYPESISRK